MYCCLSFSCQGRDLEDSSLPYGERESKKIIKSLEVYGQYNTKCYENAYNNFKASATESLTETVDLRSMTVSKVKRLQVKKM